MRMDVVRNIRKGVKSWAYDNRTDRRKTGSTKWCLRGKTKRKEVSRYKEARLEKQEVGVAKGRRRRP